MSTSPHFSGVPPLRDEYEFKLAEDEVKLEVPGYRQLDDFSCGATAGWSIIQTFRRGSLTFSQFFRDCKIDEDGANEYQVINALRKNGVGIGLRDEMSFEDIIRAIDNGFPILGSISPRGYEDHWIVLYGYGLRPARLFTCNHANMRVPHGREEIAWRRWLSMWDKESRYLICWGK